MFSSLWAYEPSTDRWYDPLARVFFEAANADGWRYSPISGNWEPSGNRLARGEFGETVVP